MQIPMSANDLLLIKMTLFPTTENRDKSVGFTVNTDNKTGLLKHYHISVPLCKFLLKIKVNTLSGYINIKCAHILPVNGVLIIN